MAWVRYAAAERVLADKMASNPWRKRAFAYIRTNFALGVRGGLQRLLAGKYGADNAGKAAGISQVKKNMAAMLANSHRAECRLTPEKPDRNSLDRNNGHAFYTGHIT